MTNIIIGNLCSLLAMVTDSISSSQKDTKSILLMQSVSQIIYCISAAVLKGYSAAVQNVVSILRNIIAIQSKHSKWTEFLLIALGVVLGLYFNNLGFFGLLPVIANLQYSIAIFHFKNNERALKISFLVCVLSFIVFNGVIMNIIGVISNSAVAVTTVIFLFRKKNK